ncbi:MAG: hypothetical protein HKO88_07570 [Xanthomonadales bacterium]|nr:hypothetical protein [Xanthomonadales bacterium]
MRFIKITSLFIVILTTCLLSGYASAQSDRGEQARVFGLGQPASIQALPNGKLRSRLESLPPQASSKALRWLQDLSFPESDLETLQIDDGGNVFYADTNFPDPDQLEAAEMDAALASEAAPPATLDDVFLLHSRPGAPNVVFVDFDGANISGTAWNNSNGVSVIEALPYNVEGDGSTFTELERTRMVDIWHRIAEDLAPYDIDVTTEEPAAFDRYTGHILVTHSIDANNQPVACTSCGGVAYVNVFGASNYHTYYSPALVFFDKLGGGGETYVAEASSHEFGHNLGLSHDGNSSTAYYGGHGSGLVSWAPIMGNSYNNNVTQWSKGEYAGANLQQDDLAIIDGKLGYRADDHGDTRASASALSVNGDGTVVSSNPELDPHNLLPENKGIIGSASDVDVFSFVTGNGTINLTINPAWDAFTRSTSRRGANLDIEAELQDLGGVTVDLDDPVTDTKADITATVSAGTYYLLVTGVGNTVTPYSDYASLGQYFINGSVPPASVDETAPTPNPMTWALAPVATSYDAITMTASTAVDDISSVQYNFQCTVGGSGCSNSGWQSSTSYTATGLSPSTSYTYQVSAKDEAGNTTAPSATASAVTAAPPPPPLTPTGLNAAASSENSIDLVWTDNASTETGYRLERSDGGQNNFTTIANLPVDANSFVDSGLEADTTYDYRVAATGSFSDSGYATASGTTDAPPPYSNFFANGETAVAGTVSGTFTNTRNDDGSSQSITERESGGKPANRHTYLEHRWSFNISAGATVTVHANAWSGGSTDGDTFDFEYSLNNGGFQRLFNVSSGAETNFQSAVIPGTPSGAVTIRVIDTDQGRGNREKNTVYVDHLYIQVGTPSSDPPIGDPSGLSAEAVSFNQIDLSWTDGTENETGFTLDRSLDNSNWDQLADLPAGSTGYTDSGLNAETTYYYRVQAYNPNGFSAYTSASATTPVEPAVTLVLSASGYKSKGKHGVNLSWTGSSDVDVYRDDELQATVSGTAYDDFIGAKGGATYTHKVCQQGSTTVCSNVTTTVF